MDVINNTLGSCVRLVWPNECANVCITMENVCLLWTKFFCGSMWFCVSCSVVSDSLRSHGLYPTRLLCPWNSPGKNTGVVCCSLLQGIFPTQGSNPGLLHCRQILYHLSHKGSPIYGLSPIKSVGSQLNQDSRVGSHALIFFFCFNFFPFCIYFFFLFLNLFIY